MDAPDRQFEPVFIAGNVREVARIEQLFQSEGIEYVVQPGQFQHAITGDGRSFDGLVFQVLAGQAAYCRRLIEGAGLIKGIIPAD